MKNRAIYLADMSLCRPAKALARNQKTNAWQILAYETTTGHEPRKGSLIYAPSYGSAPEVVLPLRVAGWHHVYIGYWNPHYAYDGGMTLKVKLASDPCFMRISEKEPLLDSGGTSLREVLFRTADLTAESLRFGQIQGSCAKKACVAYVKLVPLTKKEVSALKKERAGHQNRIITATNDGMSYFHGNEYLKKEHILELVEPYRYSDVGRVIWAVNYGDVTNYPTRVGTWNAGPGAGSIKNATNSYINGKKNGLDSLRALKAKGIIPENVAEQHVHAMGLKFDAMFRLAILGPIPPVPFDVGRCFISSNPQYRQMTRSGVSVEKASYAFPPVRAFMLSLIKEAVEKFNVDGAVLGFNRGPQFMLYEEPVLADYRREYLKRQATAGETPTMRRLLFLSATERAPGMDGRLADECWKHSCDVGDLKRSGGITPRNATRIKATFDHQGLYLAIRCEVQDVKTLKKDCPPGEKSGKAWQDDCVDMKISADGGRTVSQFVVSASGASWARSLGNETLESDWSAAVRIGEKEYTVEIAIPFQTLGITAFKPGLPLLFNIGREDRSTAASGSIQESVLAEPYLDLCQAPLLVLGDESEFRALPGAVKMAQIDYADGRNVPFTDPLMQAVRCGYLTEFVRNTRRVLDEAGAKKGRRQELSVWVYGSMAANLRFGFDVETWIKEGLIDSVIGFMSADPADDRHLIQLTKAHGCRYLAAFIPWFDYSAQTAVNKAAAAYAAGVDGLAVWDMDHAQDVAAWWPMGRMLGHAETIKAWAETAAPTLKSIRLKSVAGYDVAEGLHAAVYSGG